MRNYGTRLFKGIFHKHGFNCYDMFANIAPATLLTLLTVVINLTAFLYGSLFGHKVIALTSILEIWAAARNIYFTLFFFGLITTITEWRNIYCTPFKKIAYLFTFPIFMFTYMPIAIAALFKKVTWEPIRHTFVERVTVTNR